MTCDSCRTGVERCLAAQSGVTSAAVSLMGRPALVVRPLEGGALVAAAVPRVSRLLGPGLRHRDGPPRRHLWRRGGAARSPVAHPPPLAPRHAGPVRIRVPVLPARLPRAVARLVKHGRPRRAWLLRRV